MNNTENIHKLRVKAAYLWGLGIGITVTAFQLTPANSTPNDKYAFTAVLGAVVLLAAVGLTLYIRHQEKAISRTDNPTKATRDEK